METRLCVGYFFQDCRFIAMKIFLVSDNVTLHKKMTFSIKEFFSKCVQIHRKLQIWSHLLKKSLTKNFIFCTVRFLFSFTIRGTSGEISQGKVFTLLGARDFFDAILRTDSITSVRVIKFRSFCFFFFWPRFVFGTRSVVRKTLFLGISGF